MAKIVIGGETYESKPLKFKQLKKAFPLIQKQQQLLKAANERAKAEGVQVDLDPIEGMEVGIAIIAIALEKTHPEMTAEKIEEEIDVNECLALRQSILDIIVESGFEAAKPGEGAPAEEVAVSPSTETSTESSPSSSDAT